MCKLTNSVRRSFLIGVIATLGLGSSLVSSQAEATLSVFDLKLIQRIDVLIDRMGSLTEDPRFDNLLSSWDALIPLLQDGIAGNDIVACIAIDTLELHIATLEELGVFTDSPNPDDMRQTVDNLIAQIARISDRLFCTVRGQPIVQMSPEDASLRVG